MLDHAVAVIPADPGYFALDRLIDPNNPDAISFLRMPVIAWIVRVYNGDHEFFLEPVCTDVFSSYFHNEVLHPDGRVVRFAEEQWGSLEKFESQMRFEHEERVSKTTRRTTLAERV